MEGRYLNRKQTATKAGLSAPTIWRLERKGLFPARRQLSPGRVGWLESEVENWISARIRKAIGSVL